MNSPKNPPTAEGPPAPRLPLACLDCSARFALEALAVEHHKATSHRVELVAAPLENATELMAEVLGLLSNMQPATAPRLADLPPWRCECGRHFEALEDMRTHSLISGHAFETSGGEQDAPAPFDSAEEAAFWLGCVQTNVAAAAQAASVAARHLRDAGTAPDVVPLLEALHVRAALEDVGASTLRIAVVTPRQDWPPALAPLLELMARAVELGLAPQGFHRTEDPRTVGHPTPAEAGAAMAALAMRAAGLAAQLYRRAGRLEEAQRLRIALRLASRAALTDVAYTSQEAHHLAALRTCAGACGFEVEGYDPSEGGRWVVRRDVPPGGVVFLEAPTVAELVAQMRRVSEVLGEERDGGER